MSLRPKKIDFNAAFAEFRADLERVFAHSGLNRVKYMHMYQKVYDLCTAVASKDGFSEELFNAVSLFLAQIAGAVKVSLMAAQDIVQAYATAWEKFKSASDYANMICEYLNKTLERRIKVQRSLTNDSRYRKMSVEALAYVIWKDQIVCEIRDNCSNKLLENLMLSIRKGRDGEIIQHQPIKATVDSLVHIMHLTDQPFSVYVSEFESRHIRESKIYYERESAEFFASHTVAEFMVKASQRLESEGLRNQLYIHSSSYSKVMQCCEHEYITVHSKRLHDAFESMLLSEKFDDASMMYRLLSQTPNGVERLLEIYESFIATLGRDIIIKIVDVVAKEPKLYVEPLLDLHTKYMTICQKVFSSDAAFVASLDKAFRRVINMPLNLTSSSTCISSAEIMAKYSDSYLKKSSKSTSNTFSSQNELINPDADVEERLSKMVTLFAYIDDKDIFQKHYARLLAKRLIFGSSASDDMESVLISKLKLACGYEFTSKLQRMFTDSSVSLDLSKDFCEFVKNSAVSLGVDFQAQVLTQGSWPITGALGGDFQIPQELEKPVDLFQTFYMGKHSGRKLTWLWSFSKADVKLNGFDKRYELNLSLYQLGVLLTLNDQKAAQITVGDVVKATHLSLGDVKRSVKALVDIQLLLVKKNSKEVDENSTLEINENFSSKKLRIKVSAAIQMDTQAESDAARKAIDEDRKLYLQATIVRVMKSRKELSHQHLIQEVIDQSKSRFNPAVPLIKKCIEQLIEKAYLQRSDEKKDVYLYVA